MSGIVKSQWYCELLSDIRDLEYTGIIITKHAIGKRGLHGRFWLNGLVGLEKTAQMRRLILGRNTV